MAKVQPEHKVQDAVMGAVNEAGGIVFRQNVGMGWQGDVTVIKKACAVQLHAGDVVIRRARPLHAGLIKGSSDLIGWRSIPVSSLPPDAVIAQFVAVEVKTNTGESSPEQRHFVRMVQQAGGLAGVARSPDDVYRMFSGIPR